MGVTIIGIATKADESSVVNGLVQTFAKWNHPFKVEFESEQYFEFLINRKHDNNIVDIYSTLSGTICVMSWELFEILSKHDLSLNFDFVYFDISETTMSHRFALFSQGKEGLCMNIWDKGNSKDISGDNFLDIKGDEDIFSQVFPRAINEYIPQPFHSIDLEIKIKRYRLIKIENAIDTNDKHQKTNASIIKRGQQELKNKKWWQLW